MLADGGREPGVDQQQPQVRLAGRLRRGVQPLEPLAGQGDPARPWWQRGEHRVHLLDGETGAVEQGVGRADRPAARQRPQDVARRPDRRRHPASR
ncbi:hypothetical protein [Pseudokineococcus sp. 1T1Z-3]|uniref:hypothetical protein n=1 Tax=Pseudokineococcus sp. 1T1Z-3 TaxID=3132745 RepID=UPI0030A77BF2